MGMGDFERVKQAASIKAFAERYLTKSRGGAWCCPFCGSGTHGTPNSDGALSLDPDGEHFKCFSCQTRGDVFDLAAKVYGIDDDDQRGKLEAVASWAGVALDVGATAAKTVLNGKELKVEPQAQEEPPDYSEGRSREAAYVERMRQNLEHPDAISYLEARGFSLDDARAEGMGYDPAERRLVLPWRGCDWYHIDRDVTGRHPHKYHKPNKDKVGPQPLYNPDAVKSDVFFIVEGVLDAIALHLCGHEAVAVASNKLSGKNLAELVELVAKCKDHGEPVLMLDDDGPGQEGAERLRGLLLEAGVVAQSVVVGGNCKDAAERYQADLEGLRGHLSDVRTVVLEVAQEERETAYRKALTRLRVKDPAEVARRILTLEDAEEPTPTGIDGLDAILEGGLRSGLVGIGGLSSIGKTTFAVQVADHIAEHGRSVLFVTIEQSAQEIAAKSLSRLTYILNSVSRTVSATEAVSESRRGRWDEEQRRAFERAVRHYAAQVAPRLRILEGTTQPSVADVRAVASMMAEHDGRAPVVFIDYLQLLAAQNERDNDKQTVDKNVMSLRQLARDLRAPVCVISSLNRSSYSEGVTLDAFKESGAIEYGTDVLLGLQPRGIRDAANKNQGPRAADNLVRQHKARDNRECELVVLKNRNGRTPTDGIPLTFRPLSSVYEEVVIPKAHIDVPVV